MRAVLLPQVRGCGVRGPGQPAERPKDSDVPERHDALQPGFAQGQNPWCRRLRPHTRGSPSFPFRPHPRFNADAFRPRQGDKSVRIMRSLLASQLTFVNRLVQLMKAVQRESGNRKKKVRRGLSPNSRPGCSAPELKRAFFLSPPRTDGAAAGPPGRQREGEPFRV